MKRNSLAEAFNQQSAILTSGASTTYIFSESCINTQSYSFWWSANAFCSNA